MTRDRSSAGENLSLGPGPVVGARRWPARGTAPGGCRHASPQSVDAWPTPERVPRPLGALAVAPLPTIRRLHGDDDGDI